MLLLQPGLFGWFGLEILNLLSEYLLQTNNPPHVTTKKPVTPIVTIAPCQRWHIDFKGPLYDNPKEWYFLICIDHFSKYLWVEVFRRKEAPPVAEFMRSLMLRCGPPAILQSNNGGEFINGSMDGMNRWCVNGSY